MPRPKGYDPATVAARMRDAFWTHGYDGTSLGTLSGATGLRSGSLHAGFGQKPALFAAALDAYDPAFLGAMEIEGRGRAKLRAYADLLHDRAVADPDRRGCFVVASAAELDRHTDANRAAILSRLARMRRFIDDALAEDGIDDAERAAGFLGAVVGLLALARCGTDAATLGALRDAAKRGLDG
ncbi:hypothetical protein JQC91_06405 [Jannaschia sp. Os4]|uniref:TetR/AcrR family transcriptional regulator n=1 Tax=Jannaschia sp. Os4 TaxID=2807617 RepID=UPI00193A5A61|nr:hypothetical protein [Jannaschia sp. Os4]MBM2575929.1 hypothetical protein [Jannaschia sp. Os4]